MFFFLALLKTYRIHQLDSYSHQPRCCWKKSKFYSPKRWWLTKKKTHTHIFVKSTHSSLRSESKSLTYLLRYIYTNLWIMSLKMKVLVRLWNIYISYSTWSGYHARDFENNIIIKEYLFFNDSLTLLELWVVRQNSAVHSNIFKISLGDIMVIFI